MSKRTPENQPPPDPDQPEVSPEARQDWEDFRASSKETQKELKSRAEEEAWALYDEAHETTRQDALAGVRARLHRMEQRGIEVTPEMEERELEQAEHVEDGPLPTIRTRRKKGRAQKGDAKTEVKNATKEALDEAVREQGYAAEAERASSWTNHKIERARSRDEVAVEELAEKLRREDALTNVENHIRNTSEQGARWYPWERVLARRRAVRELKDKELSADWLAYALERYHDQQDEYLKNGQSLSETRRTLSASGDRIKETWKKGGLRRLYAMPARLLAEGVRLSRYAFKRGRKETRAWQQRAESKQPTEPPKTKTESDSEGS